MTRSASPPSPPRRSSPEGRARHPRAHGMHPAPDAAALVAEGMARVREAAAFLGVSRAFVYGLLARGALPSVVTSQFRRGSRNVSMRRIPWKALRNLAAARLVNSRQRAEGSHRPCRTPERDDERTR